MRIHVTMGIPSSDPRAANSREVELSVGDLPALDNANAKDVIITEKVI